MNRRGLLKNIGVGLAAVVAVPTALLGKRKAKRPMTFKGTPLVWDDGKPKHLAHTGHGLVVIEIPAEPVLFVGGPLHGQIWSIWNKRDGCAFTACGFREGSRVQGDYTRQGPYAIKDGLEGTEMDKLCAEAHGFPDDAAEYKPWMAIYKAWDKRWKGHHERVSLRTY